MDRSTGGYVLSADLGTTGLKVAVVDDDGVVRGHAGESLPMIFVGDGGVEQDPELWWQALARCARRALAAAAVDGSAIARLAVTSQYSTTVAVDAAGMPLANATMWMDRRSSRHHSAGGRPGQVAHLRVANPAAYARSAALVEPVDALCARLTGRVTATQNTMFPLGVIDNTVWDNTAYSPELVGQVGIDPQRLPQLLAFGEPRGTVTVTAAEFLGVRHGTPVMSGTVDSVTSAIGTGALDPHSCGLIIGTTSVIVTHVGSAREDAAHGLATAPSPMPHSWFVVAENGIGGKALDVFVRNIVFPDDGLGRQLPDNAFHEVVAAAATSPVGSNGVLFLPWLVGSLAPRFDLRMRGGFVNLDITSSRADMARAILEGVALNAAWLTPFVAELAGGSENHYATITLGGGGAASGVWGQIFADVLGCGIRRLSNPQTTNAHGAALLALVDAGVMSWSDIDDVLAFEEVHEPDLAATDSYRRLLAAFVDFHERSAPFYRSLNKPEATP